MFLLSAGTLWAQQAAGLLPVQEDTHCKEWVEQTLSRMKLKDKVGQLLFIPWLHEQIKILKS